MPIVIIPCPQCGCDKQYTGKYAENNAKICKDKICNSCKNQTRIIPKRTEESRLKSSLAIKQLFAEGKIKPTIFWLGKHRSAETKNKIRKKHLQNCEDGVYYRKETRPENEMKNILDEIHIEYVQQYRYGSFVFDFYLPHHDVFIECDGDYWHGNPERININNLSEAQKNNICRDKIKDAYMNKNKKILLRFWEHDILNNHEVIKIKLKLYGG